MIGLLGKKLQMTQLYDDEGRQFAVTVIEAGPCTVTQVKGDGEGERKVVQLGYQEVKEEKLILPQRGFFKKNDLPMMKYLKEFPLGSTEEEYKKGQSLTVEIFNVGDRVDIIGKTKGRGFQGVVKRWGFSGYNSTHGTKDKHRVPGSIGASTFPARVWKNKRLPGRYGNERMTIKNLKVMKIIPEENLIFLKGAVPGSRGSLLTIKTKKKTGE
jgi:large subunit ribosomal protein L3